MDETIERRIRDRAYRLWEQEGRPAGRDVDHWLRAAQEVAAEEHTGEDAGNGTAEVLSPAPEATATQAKPKRTRAAKPKEVAAEAPADTGQAEPAKKRRSRKSG